MICVFPILIVVNFTPNETKIKTASDKIEPADTSYHRAITLDSSRRNDLDRWEHPFQQNQNRKHVCNNLTSTWPVANDSRRLDLEEGSLDETFEMQMFVHSP